VRAKRSLAGLPGGGGTPLAAGLEVAAELADALARRGDTPVVVLLTDGRANVARDGRGGREAALDDAQRAARVLRGRGHAALLLDTSPRPDAQAAAIADELGARYVPLPRADAHALSRAVLAASG
jgi:magnesium chelatase subunit D